MGDHHGVRVFTSISDVSSGGGIVVVLLLLLMMMMMLLMMMMMIGGGDDMTKWTTRLCTNESQIQPNTLINYIRMAGQFLLRALSIKETRFDRGQLHALVLKEDEMLTAYYWRPTVVSNERVPW